MPFVLPVFSLLLSAILGFIVTKRISILIPKYSTIFYVIPLGIILFTAINYFMSLIFSFPKGIIISQLIVLVFEIFYILRFGISLNLLSLFSAVFKEKLLFISMVIIGAILYLLFNHHIIPSINGDLYTGESTYGDLPFHLSIISNIAYSNKFPPGHPMYAEFPLAYPYLINFFSAILVYEGWSLRLSIIIPGLLLSLSLIGLIYDFAFSLTKSSIKSFLSVFLYFFNGGLGFYFFLRDYSFNLTSIFQALFNPTALKEYSHLFEQNIQWGNFLSRMIVPERSLLFGIPAGIIILRLLFFRESQKKHNIFDLILAALLLSLMPLLHTHTVLAMAVILPIIGLLVLKKESWVKQLIIYAFIIFLTTAFAIPHIPLFLNHITGTESFFKLHLWWMTGNNESPVWFWFKNTYLYIPLSLIVIAAPKIANKQIKNLQIIALVIFVTINVALFSPYNWDNVKFLFWAGLFLAIGAASLLGYLLQTKNLTTKIVASVVIMTMISSALLSILRETNVQYMLFSKETAEIGKQIKKITPPDSVFLTYKIHNSPVSNLAGRQIMMGYPGLLWVHGINYQNREKDINDVYAGINAQKLIDKYNITYVVLESYNPEGMFINREFFNQYPKLLESKNYTVYQVK